MSNPKPAMLSLLVFSPTPDSSPTRALPETPQGKHQSLLSEQACYFTAAHSQVTETERK